MNLDTLIITVFCLLDDRLKQLRQQFRWRTRGFAPSLSDAEVLTIETVGELLGFETDAQLFNHFRRHFADLFPALRQIHRTTFVRQSANLAAIKELLWQRLLPLEQSCDISIVDSFAVAVCRFGRNQKAKLFRADAAYGKDHLAKATIFGFRFHVRIRQSGFITRLAIAPANVSDLAVLPQLVEQSVGVCLGDRNYWSPSLSAEFKEQGLQMCVPFRKKSADPTPERSRLISRNRQIIETVFSQLTVRFRIKRIWARDIWHLSSRVMRKVLTHTIGVWLNCKLGFPPLQLAKLLNY